MHIHVYIHIYIFIDKHVGHPIDLCKVQPLQGQALGSSLGVVTPRPASANNGSCNLWMDVHFPPKSGTMGSVTWVHVCLYR